jgi:hypothetical protein
MRSARTERVKNNASTNARAETDWTMSTSSVSDLKSGAEGLLAGQPLPLQALLNFIATECAASMPASASGFNLVDFVMQLLAANKEQLYGMCRGGDAAMRPSHSMFKSAADDARIQEPSAKREKIEQTAALISLPTPLSTSISADDINPCIRAVSSGMKRRDVRFLRQVFDQHTDGTGCLPACNLARALNAAAAPVIPPSDASTPTLYCNSDGMVEFSGFERAVAVPDELALYFQERRQPALADALRALVGCGGDQLLRVSQLSSADMRAACSAVCVCLPEQALVLHEELQRSFAAQFEMQAQMDADPGKFNAVIKMACGGVDDFHHGLTGRVGMPHLKFKDAMRQEHCQKAGCNTSFTTGNYKITTTPNQEWLYIAGDETGQQIACPHMGHGRRILPMSELMKLKLAMDAKLTDVEVLAIVLYTGPMFQVSQQCVSIWAAAVGYFNTCGRSITAFCAAFLPTSSNCSKMGATCTQRPFLFSCLQCRKFRDALASLKALCCTVDLED